MGMGNMEQAQQLRILHNHKGQECCTFKNKKYSLIVIVFPL
jgi:hypothetical protein